MKASKITGFFINVCEEYAEVRTIANELESFYELLGVNLIECPSRRIGIRSRKYYDIICDEEGLFVENPKISAIDNLGRPQLVGNLFIVNNDDEGNFTSLTAEDIKHIKRYVMEQSTHKYPIPYPMLMQCEF